MAKRLLNEDEIRHLIGLIRDLFDHQESLRAREPLAELIQFPKIPPNLSESLAVHLINSGVLMGKLADGVHARLSAAGGDVVISQPVGNDLQIEVKGTAESAFQHFGPKDIASHIVLWVHYGSCFRDGGTCADVHLLVKPGRFIPTPGRITLGRLAQLAGGELIRARIDLSTLGRVDGVNEAET